LSKTRYILKDVFGKRNEIEISGKQASQIEDAYNFLMASCRVEDLHSLLAISYKEFESFVFQCGLNEMVDGSSSTGEPIELKFGRYRDEANQKFMNLANSYRALCDQAPQHLSKSGKHSSALDEGFARLKNEAFDNEFAYRLFDFLRNMSTHHALPVTKANPYTVRLSPTQVDQSGGLSIDKISLELTVARDVLLKVKKGRTKTKTEVEKIVQSEIDIKAIIRGFIAAQFTIRQNFHDKFVAVHEEAEQVFKETYESFADRNGSQAKFIELFKETNGQYTRILPVKSTFPELVQQLKSRWQGLIFVNKRYPSIEISDQKYVFRVSSEDLWVR